MAFCNGGAKILYIKSKRVPRDTIVLSVPEEYQSLTVRKIVQCDISTCPERSFLLY